MLQLSDDSDDSSRLSDVSSLPERVESDDERDLFGDVGDLSDDEMAEPPRSRDSSCLGSPVSDLSRPNILEAAGAAAPCSPEPGQGRVRDG